MRSVLIALIVGVSLTAFTPVRADDVIWDFEEGDDHGFTLTSVNPATAAPDDPATAGDEAVTGIGGPRGLPDAGVAWTVGRPDQFDGFRPALQEGDKIKADGTLEYNQPGTNHPFAFPINGRGQESYLSTYNLTQWGDNVHTEQNDQIARSPLVLLGDGAVLTVWAYGGGSGTHAPALEPNPAAGYTTGSAGIAVLSAADGSFLTGVLTNGHGSLRQDTIDLSAYAGQKVRIEVVDAFDGAWGWLAVDEIRIANAISLGAAPEQAVDPNPPDEATDVPLDVVLSWTPGEYAPALNGHQVYLGANFDDVNEGLVEVSRAVTSDPAFDTADLPFALDLETTYYWRIDEANAVSGSDRGNVWSFTTEPFGYPVESLTVKASSQQVASPATRTIDGSGLNADDQHSDDLAQMWMSIGVPAWIQYTFDKEYKLDELWVWNANSQLEAYMAFGAKDVTIEYSTDGEVWAQLEDVPEFARGTGMTTYTANTVVNFGGVTAKYVRLTINATWGSPIAASLSEVRFFYVPVRAREPQPADGATGVSVATDLIWRPGREAAKHEVYFDKDEQIVTDGIAPVATTQDAVYSPLSLDLGTTYYWRVDETNDLATPGIWAGDVWNFSTAEYMTVDDFESYTDDYEAGQAIWQTWIDGIEDPQNGGSQVGNSEAPFAEQTLVHGGRQSMPLAYDNTATFSFSEAVRTFDNPQDWTASSIKSLSLWFYGDPDNTGQLYLKINSTKVPYNGDTSDIKRKQWQPWNIDLSAVGENLKNITKLTIGVEGAGTAGVIYVDDIRLYPRTPELIVPVDPGKNGLLAEYLFDNGATDSSGNGYNGTFLGNARAADSVLVLDGIDDAVSIPRLGGPNATFNQCTYSMWMYSVREPATAGIIGGINSNDWGPGGIHCKLFDGRANAGVNALAGGDMNGKTIVGPDEWVHLALTVSDTEATIYLNGQPEASRGFSTLLTMILGNGSIGAWNNNGDIQRELTGEMDDVRIYDRGVSEAELLWLAGKRTPVHKPF